MRYSTPAFQSAPSLARTKHGHSFTCEPEIATGNGVIIYNRTWSLWKVTNGESTNHLAGSFDSTAHGDYSSLDSTETRTINSLACKPQTQENAVTGLVELGW